MGYWKRHQKPDLEDVLQQFHDAGWSIEDPPKYYTVKCPCGYHMRQIHLTPSNRHYANQALKWMNRQECMQPQEQR
ncbi:hypothetical protein DFO66_103402 [Brevibacterium sanguinis]|uniref:Uncharacterized protein n=2 Tax=Brevibacterium TaxID=1696 RepID=A0A366IKY9_9MICO|nr:hypothetical protein DFO66_103402 [Brevibacterium sanguinis]RBP73104.1 hypothetical protein DFO65_103402 [Brevibacterium celere]